MSLKELGRRLDAIDKQIDSTMCRLDELQAKREAAYNEWMMAREAAKKG